MASMKKNPNDIIPDLKVATLVTFDGKTAPNIEFYANIENCLWAAINMAYEIPDLVPAAKRASDYMTKAIEPEQLDLHGNPQEQEFYRDSTAAHILSTVIADAAFAYGYHLSVRASTLPGDCALVYAAATVFDNSINRTYINNDPVALLCDISREAYRIRSPEVYALTSLLEEISMGDITGHEAFMSLNKTLPARPLTPISHHADLAQQYEVSNGCWVSLRDKANLLGKTYTAAISLNNNA